MKKGQKLILKNGKPAPEASEPLRNKKDIKDVKDYFLNRVGNIKYYCLFVLGINVGLRCGDLLKLKFCDILENGNHKIIEQKTDKKRELEFNENAINAVKLYVRSLGDNFNMEDYIFISQKTNKPLTVKSVHKIIKTACKKCGIKGNYGSHTMRKTWAYHLYMSQIEKNPWVISTLQSMMNHSSQEVTLRYIGISKEAQRNLYHSNNL